MRKDSKTPIIFLAILVVLTFIYMFVDLMQNEDKVETYEISVITNCKSNESLIMLKEGAEQAAIDLNVDIRFIFLSEDNNEEEQIELLIRESKNNIDAIIIDPIESIKVANTIENINAKMPVVVIQSSIDTIDTVNKILCDEYSTGSELVEVALEYEEEEGNVLIVTGDIEDIDSREMEQGVIETIKALNKKYITYHIREEDKTTYYQLNEKIVSSNIKTVICLDIKSTEYMAKYKDKSIKNNYKKIKFNLYGVGSTNRIISFLEQSIINGTAIRNEFSIGYLAIENAVKLNRSENISNKTLKSKVITSEDMYSEENERVLFQFIR